MRRVAKIMRGDDGTLYGYKFNCPGCKAWHVVPVKPHPQGWDFNGDEEWPTFAPSILLYEHDVRLPDGSTGRSYRCHSFVCGGNIQFLSDSTHPLTGRTVELPEVTE